MKRKRELKTPGQAPDRARIGDGTRILIESAAGAGKTEPRVKRAQRPSGRHARALRQALKAGASARLRRYMPAAGARDQPASRAWRSVRRWVDHELLRFRGYPAQRAEGLAVALLLAGRSPTQAAEEKTVWAQGLSSPCAVAPYPRPLSQAAAVVWCGSLGADAADEFCRSVTRRPELVKEVRDSSIRSCARRGMTISRPASGN